MKSFKALVSSFIFSSLIALPAWADKPVTIEDMTWPEIRQRITDGATTVIVPTGGTEQNGPHMIVGKHNIIVRYTADRIARKLGDTLVTPVISFVPEGRIEPPEGHMRFPGTLSVSDATFGALLGDTARSLKQHGFRLICFVGDHGGSQDIQQQVAAKLTEDWRKEGVRVLQVSDYYFKNGQEAWIESMHLDFRNPDAHAGHIDTAELMAIDRSGVRDALRAAYTEDDYAKTGAMGDATTATVEYGRRYLELKVEAAVNQIKHARQ